MRARRAARQGRVGSPLEEAVRPPALVGLEVQQDHVFELAGVEHSATASRTSSYMPYIPVWMSAGRSSSIRNWLNWKSKPSE
jgi:hypothetical protein